jgi:hypothetical protein
MSSFTRNANSDYPLHGWRSLGSLSLEDQIRSGLCGHRISFANPNTGVLPCPVCSGKVDLSHALQKRIARVFIRRDRLDDRLVVKAPIKVSRPGGGKANSRKAKAKASPKPVIPLSWMEKPYHHPTIRFKVKHMIFSIPFGKWKPRFGGNCVTGDPYLWPRGQLPLKVLPWFRRWLSDRDVHEHIKTFLIRALEHHRPNPNRGLKKDLNDLSLAFTQQQLLAAMVEQSYVYSEPEPYKPIGFKEPDRAPVDSLRLQGRLVRKFLQARHRGYRGGPSHWLRSSRTARLSDGWSRSLSLQTKNPLLCWSIPAMTAPRGDQTQRLAAAKSHFQLLVRAHDSRVHRENRALAVSATRSSWPKERFPSAPTLIEWEQRRREGKPLAAPGWGPREKLTLTPRQFNENVGLLCRTVRRLIVAVRSDLKVPGQFLPYFRYRWGFLILTCRNPPLELSRWLISQWRVRCTSVWLKYNLTFRKFLKAVPTQWVSPTTQPQLM